MTRHWPCFGVCSSVLFGSISLSWLYLSVSAQKSFPPLVNDGAEDDPGQFPAEQERIPGVRDDVEDNRTLMFPLALPSSDTLVPHRWPVVDGRCCAPPAAPLVIDTHIHIWDEDPRPNRGLNQLGLLEDVLTESWGQGVHLGVLVQPGFREANNTYIERSLKLFPGSLSGEIEYIIDYPDIILNRYDSLGIRGLRFKATSLQKYIELIEPRLPPNPQFYRIVNFMKARNWHFGVQLTASVSEKWVEILKILQETGLPIIVDMFGRPDPLQPAGADLGTQAIVVAAAKPAPAGKIWMEFGGPFRVDPRCTYAVPSAADPKRCLPKDRVIVQMRGTSLNRSLCCPPKTHKLLIDLARLFLDVCGEDFVVWGTDWPFISDQGVTVQALLDVMLTWVPNETVRDKVLGLNSIRPNSTGKGSLYTFRKHLGNSEFLDIDRKLSSHSILDKHRLKSYSVLHDSVSASASGSPRKLQSWPTFFNGTLVDRWNEKDARCCTTPSAPLVIDTHMHVWDEDPRPNRGLNQLGLLEDVVTESWGVGVHLGVLVQPGFRDANNTYILRSLERFPHRLAAEVEFVVDYDDETLLNMHRLGTRGLRFKATSLAKYLALVTPRLESPEFNRVSNFMLRHNWHWGVQLAKEANLKWEEILLTLQATNVPVIIDMFGRPDPLQPVGKDIGTQAILAAASRYAAGQLWIEFGGPFRVDPRCTYAEPLAADPSRCLLENRVDVPYPNGTSRALCCPVTTHNLLISLAGLFTDAVGENHIVWGTDWPFISDVGVTVRALLDVMIVWVPDARRREKALGTNAVRPGAVGDDPLFPLFWLHEEMSNPRNNLASDFLGAIILTMIPFTLIMGCCCEVVRKYRSEADNPIPMKVDASKSEKAGPVHAGGYNEFTCCACASWMSRAYDAFGERFTRCSGAFDGEKGGFLICLSRKLEPVQGFPPPTCRLPILGDVIAGAVKAISELVGCLTFASLLTPDYLQPFLPVFLNYALWGFIVSQFYYNLTSRYSTPARTCNISASIFFLDILAMLRGDLYDLEMTVNTLLMGLTLMTWFAGVIIWTVGSLRLTQFVRFLSSPVKLGMQGSLGYFLFATSFSISSGVSWLDFQSMEEFGMFFTVDLLPKWMLTVICAISVFSALKKWGWPYTIPVFVCLGVIMFYAGLLVRGSNVEEAQNSGWLYPPPADSGGDYNPLEFLTRIYDFQSISWSNLLKSAPSIITAAIIAPFLSAVINLILIESTFPAEDIGKSTLAYELRHDGMAHLILAVIGGFSTSPSAGGIAVHRKVGARSNWGLFTSIGIHAGFLFIPGCTSIIQYTPKYVVGTISLIVAISMLDSGIRGGYAALSLKEFSVVCITISVSIFYGLQAGIALGWAFSFALFIQETARTAPVRLDVDAGLVASHAVWGMRSSRVVARIRGAIRLVCFQGFLFFAAIQPALKDIAHRHFKEDAVIFLVIDLSSVMGMDDSTPVEFKAFGVEAASVGISLVFSGCAPGVLTKLRKAGVLPSGNTTELLDADELMEHAQCMADHEQGQRFFIVQSTDRAIEFCELTLVLRSITLCPDAVPPPSSDHQSLANLFNAELVQYRRNFYKGDALERNQGETLILLKGAVQACVELHASSEALSRPEAVVVYRAIPSLEEDFCFTGGAPGYLEVVEPSTVLALPTGALSDLQSSGRWPEIEVLWSQLAEFMASTMHPMAMKATMHDVHGKFSSAAADAYEQAVADSGCDTSGSSDDRRACGDRRGFMQRILVGSGARIAEFRKSLTVNFAGQKPVYSFRTNVGSDTALHRSVSGLSKMSAGSKRTKFSKEFDSVLRSEEDADETGEERRPRWSLGSTLGIDRSRTSTAESGHIYVGLEEEDREAELPTSQQHAEDIVPTAIGRQHDEISAVSDDMWSVNLQFALCGEGQEAQFQGKAMIIDADVATSVASAVNLLNEGTIDCPDGFCIVHSATSRAYYVIFKESCRGAAKEQLLVSRAPPLPPPAFSPSQQMDLIDFGPDSAS